MSQVIPGRQVAARPCQKARLVITTIEVEGRTPAEVVAAYGVSRSWVYELPAPYPRRGPRPARGVPAQPAHDERQNPQSVGSGVLDVLRHHISSGVLAEPPLSL